MASGSARKNSSVDVRLVSLLIVASIATIGSGCGGSSGDSLNSDSKSDAAAPLTKAQFLEHANAACAEERAGLKQRLAKYERLSAGRKPAPGADMVHLVFLPTIEAQIFRLEELGAPPGQAVQVDTLLDTERRAVDTVAVIPRVPSIAKAVQHFSEADKLFRAYGLGACANEPA